MRANRVVANITAQDPGLADKFYGQVLGLDLLMDMGWIRTFGCKTNVSVQVSFMSEGGSGTTVPDLSVEVMTLKPPVTPSRKPASLLSMARPTSPGACGVSLFAIPLAAS